MKRNDSKFAPRAKNNKRKPTTENKFATSDKPKSFSDKKRTQKDNERPFNDRSRKPESKFSKPDFDRREKERPRFDDKNESKSRFSKPKGPSQKFNDNKREDRNSFEKKPSRFNSRFSDDKSTGYERKKNNFSKDSDFKEKTWKSKSDKPFGNKSDRPYGTKSNKPYGTKSDKPYERRDDSFKSNKRFSDKSYSSKRKKYEEDDFKEEEKFIWPIRLNRFVSNSGICSRRDADVLIEKGLFQINGKVVTELGAKVNKKDIVTYKGKKILPEMPVYLLINKPKDCITTTSDESGRKTVMDLVADATDVRIYPVGRLDRNTTGVLLLTNDGEVAQKLTHPSFEIRKVYEVTLEEKATLNQLEMLAAGITLEDGVAFADSVAFPDPTNKRVVGIEIHSGKNRIVRRMFEALGHQVVKLDRVMFGPFTKKGLDRGKYRFLKNSEISQLKRSKKRL